MLPVKFIYNWPSHLEKKVLKTPQCILIMLLNKLPTEQDMSLHLNKVEFHSPKNTLCQVWMKFIALTVILEKKIKIEKVYNNKRKQKKLIRT